MGATMLGVGLHTNTYEETMLGHVCRDGLQSRLAVSARLRRFREISEDDLDLIFGYECEVVTLVEVHVSALGSDQ